MLSNGNDDSMMGLADPLNLAVGARLRERRRLLGLTRKGLAAAAGLTFGQLRQYENGANRIDAARLAALSRALDVPPEWFFRDVPIPPRPVMQPPPDLDNEGYVAHRPALALIRAFSKVRDPRRRHGLLALFLAVGDAELDGNAGDT